MNGSYSGNGDGSATPSRKRSRGNDEGEEGDASSADGGLDAEGSDEERATKKPRAGKGELFMVSQQLIHPCSLLTLCIS